MRKLLPVLLLISAFLLVSCGPAVKPATGSTAEGGEVFTVALPRITVDVKDDGTPSFEGIDMGVLARLTGQDPSTMRLLDSSTVNWMKAANIQHVELRQGGDGLYVFVNGKPMPYLAWNDASLQKASDMANVFTSANTEAIRKFLPIIRRLGLDVALRFPRADGVAEIPMSDPTATASLAAKATGAPASAVVQFEVKYDQNGTPAILGLTPYDLMAMGINPGAVNLHPDYVRWLQQNNIQNVELRGKEDGLYVYVNGEPLPNIVWDNTFLQNAADVYGQLNDQRYTEVQAIKSLLPLVNKADVGVLVHFPVAPGKAVIPAEMHQ